VNYKKNSLGVPTFFRIFLDEVRFFKIIGGNQRLSVAETLAAAH
jgi:hypothetical protein